MAGVAAGGGGKVVTGNGADSAEYNIAVMLVLALETVTPLGSVAVWRDGTCVARTGDGAVPHAARLPQAWIAAVAGVGATLEAVDRLVVVSGPGSFTGVRIGMASAQGLALTRGWPVFAVPTLDAIAESWRTVHAGAQPRVVIACLDGLRGEVFAREFHFDGADMHPQDEPRVVTPDQLRWQAFGDGVSIIGSGAVRYGGSVPQGADEIADVPEPIAAGAARLVARDALPAVSPHALRPIYVRRPDVELARERGRPHVR